MQPVVKGSFHCGTWIHCKNMAHLLAAASMNDCSAAWHLTGRLHTRCMLAAACCGERLKREEGLEQP